MTKIGLISDMHASPAPLQEALSLFEGQGVDRVLCAGDIAGYGEKLDETVEILKASEVISILGNHDIWFVDEHPDADACDYLNSLPGSYQTEIEGIKLYMAHASPPESVSGGIKLLDKEGNLLQERKNEWSQELTGFPHDVLVLGHTHQVFSEQLANTLAINPGSSKFNHTCAILSLPNMAVEVFALSGKMPVKVWNWSAAFTGS